MCGRFSIAGELDFYADYFAVDDVLAEPREKSWNVAPTDHVYVVAESDNRRQLATMRWGLVPHWAKDERSIHINARSETAARTAAFRDSFARRRCLIPADGFYEWEPAEKGRSPHWVFRADGYPMAFAGIWAARLDPETQRWSRTCAILTVEAEGVVARIHDRMPISLSPDVWGPWLDRGLADPEVLSTLLQPIDPDLLMEHPVSRRVNSVRNDGPDLRDPVSPETLF